MEALKEHLRQRYILKMLQVFSEKHDISITDTQLRKILIFQSSCF